VKTRFVFGATLLALCAASQPGIHGGDKKKDDPFAGMPKPGPEHQMLAKLAGTWSADVKSWFAPGEPTLSKGNLNRNMILDGRYLQESFQGEFLGAKFKGLGIIGYDAAKKKYFMAWFDNFGTGLTTSDGTYDPKTKRYTYLGEEDNPQMGGKMKTRDVLTIVSDDQEHFEMYRMPLAQGKEFKVMEITYTRKNTPKAGNE
jgi:hypothetical protein